MLRELRILAVILLIAAIGFLTRISLKQNQKAIIDLHVSNGFKPISGKENHYLDITNYNQTSKSETIILNPSVLLQQGNGILFVETTDRMEEPSLVLCSIESAARVYPDRPVVFFMNGLHDILTYSDEMKARGHYPTLSSYKNIHLFPLRLEQLFADTPMLPWYKKVDPNKEYYWTHVKSDACRFAMMWKYGGIYMDTDIISLQPIPEDRFLAAETFLQTSSAVFGLSPHHNMTLEFMKNFVQNYRGDVWGHQGPGVFTRVVKKHCGLPRFNSTDDTMCGNVSYFHPQRFYPILYPFWQKYFEVWSKLPYFNNSYALHLWNFMNKKRETMVPGSNTLVEHLYKQYCPSTYTAILNKNPTYH
ncbi:alpha-1,4-N-acetylglucosaminyltransferase-like [Leptodactylus fuscus]|uniref:alpha-1,4-N-acetylglucosaminyltransferase-like n=1 Tax=Leptodactylus fuscus TaxID=238119 RepID=UPI003F4F25D3